VLTALSPSEQVVKIVRDELVALLGKDTARFNFASKPPTVILMAGLQGSGKTTTSGKLAAWLKKGGHRPMLVSVDVYRPAAREQLKVVAKQVEARLYEGDLKGEAAGIGAGRAPCQGSPPRSRHHGLRHADRRHRRPPAH
jgi:signal recognition particle subunit SRP54